MARDRPQEITPGRPPEPSEAIQRPAEEAGEARGKKQEKPPPKPTEPDGNLRADLQSVQAQAITPPPERVPLQIPRKDDMGQPAQHPPMPPAPAKPAPAPRMVHENERAPAGMARYKIRCLNYGTQERRYVLAADEESARRCYVESMGLDAVGAALGDGAPEPRLSVKKLPD